MQNHLFSIKNKSFIRKCNPLTVINCRNTLFLGFFIVVLINPCLAQTSYTPLEQDDYEIIDEKLRYNPGVQFHGYYRAYSVSRRRDIFGDEYSSHMNQIISLELQSKLNTNVSVYATLQNKLSLLENQESGYAHDNPYDETDSSSDSGMDATFEEAYLEYNHNPHAILKIGRHHINVGDRKGLTYEGTNTAISQSCRIGTWCTYIGGTRLGTDDALYWMQLDYPVYFNDIKIPDLWGDEKTRQQSSLNIELFRLQYGGLDTPLAKYGGPTSANSEYHQTDSSGDLIYYNNNKVEYAGVNILWNYYAFSLDFSYILMSGHRTYHTGSQASGQSTSEINLQGLSGSAVHLDLSHQLNDTWRIEGSYLITTGNDASATDDFWEKESKAYFEIQKGNFGKALVYFAGIEGMGEGHSVSNLEYRSVTLSNRSDTGNFGMDFSYHVFKRVKSVFDNENNKVNNIGSEFDMLFTWQFEERLKFQSYLVLFQAGDAYATNDNLVPGANEGDDDTDAFYLGLNIHYIF